MFGRFQNIIGHKYENIDNDCEQQAHLGTVMNLRRESFGVTPECLTDENEEDRLIYDEHDEVIYIE